VTIWAALSWYSAGPVIWAAISWYSAGPVIWAAISCYSAGPVIWAAISWYSAGPVIWAAISWYSAGPVIWAAISWYSAGPVITRVDILGNQVHPAVQMFPNNDAIFQDDNSPVHTTRIADSWFEEHEDALQHLPQPAQSQISSNRCGQF